MAVLNTRMIVLGGEHNQPPVSLLSLPVKDEFIALVSTSNVTFDAALYEALRRHIPIARMQIVSNNRRQSQTKCAMNWPGDTFAKSVPHISVTVLGLMKIAGTAPTTMQMA